MIGFRHVIQSTVDADVTVNVNSVNEGTFSSLSDINISVTDGTNPVTPDDVIKTGNNLEIQVPAASAPVGATLIKTGQTTSYRTGDDGDIEAGRATNFTTLAVNNPFGNTNRFTDELGGQTYTNNIVIDWSTYDSVGGTVLGYRRTVSGVNKNWNNSIDEALLVSIGSFTSGWRLPNINELINIINYGSNSVLNYSPINLNSYLLWTSSTPINNTTMAYMVLATTANGNIGTATKSVTTGAGLNCDYIPVRTFTVTGTTLS